MLRAGIWSEKLGRITSHGGRILRILVLFMCALGILVVIYRARGARIEKENANKPLKQ
jgi:cbb3-type cytochrome oxidase subunit 3